MSNVCFAPYQPIFAETIEPPERRLQQWARIRASGVDQRTCDVYPDQAAYLEWIKAHPIGNLPPYWFQ